MRVRRHGGRCRETGFLEIHHVVPYAAGGQTVVENLELRCRAHNAYEADLYFGSPELLIVGEIRDAFDNSVRTEFEFQKGNGLPQGRPPQLE